MVMPSGPDVIMSGVMMSGVMIFGVMISGAIISGRVAGAVMGAVAGAVVGAAGEFWLALLGNFRPDIISKSIYSFGKYI